MISTEEMLRDDYTEFQSIESLSNKMIDTVNDNVDDEENIIEILAGDVKKKGVKVKIINMEKEMKRDLDSNNGFIITDKYGLDKSNTVRLENGIYSPKYGTIWGDENAFEELHSCECKKLKGKRNEGLICPHCKTEVIFRDKNSHMTGWFKLNDYKIIHPNLYYKIASLIGYTRLKEILTPDWETDVSGIPKKPIIDEKTRNDKKYDHIGFLEFQRRFDEIIDFFYSKKKQKKEVYEFIKKHRNKVFCNCLPCIQLFLRPIVLGDEDFNYAKINPKYASLSNKFYNINNNEYGEKEEKTLVARLYSIQKTYFYICDLLMDLENKKEGHIRNNMLGFRINYATRAVITSLSGTKINEIYFPYLGFLEMYRPEILNTLCKLRRITINEAYMIWKRAQVTFDKTVYRVMEYIVENYDLWICLNRNPKFNF